MSWDHASPRFGSLPLLLLSTALAFAPVAERDALAQAPHASPVVGTDPAPRTAPSSKATGGLSKFEARRMRHACQERANEKGLRGQDRDTFLGRCFFGRAATRGIRRDCRKQGQAKGLDRTTLREFVRECVRERTHQKPGE
jgi:hypothetical protein